MTNIPMQRADWSGVFPAITTPLRADDSIDLELFGTHAAWMVEHGCGAIVTPGSLGEGGLLTLDEKRSLWTRAVEAVGAAVPVVAAVGACSTRESVEIARAAHACGCRGLMVLPPYAYTGDWRETRTHFAHVLEATPPMMGHGFCTVCPPVTDAPASRTHAVKPRITSRVTTSRALGSMSSETASSMSTVSTSTTPLE